MTGADDTPAAPAEVAVRSRLHAAGGAPGGLADEQRQLAEVTFSYAAAFVVAWLVVRLAQPQPGPLLGVPDLAALVAVVTSLGLTLVAVRRLLPANRIQQITPAYLVFGALWIAFVELWRPLPPDSLVVGISWICLWILVYPLITPGPRVTGVWATVLAASTGPMVLALAVATGARQLPHAGVWVLLFVPNYIAAALSVIPTQRLLQIEDARRMGSYTLTQLVGRGGMGEVWRAEHRLLVRPAAIKLLRPHGGSSKGEPELLERFQREAQTTSELQSPHTVRLFDFGITDDGRMYYVMELLQGLDMESLVRRFGPLPAERMGHLLRQACLSLAEAHGAGLVHLDIKPRNLFVCRAGIQVDFVKVLDFGLVRRGDGSVREGSPADRTAVGTPGYLAPETVMGMQADARTDIYGLGCVAFWLLTGRQVFERRIATMLAMDHAQRPPPPPSRFADDIPDSLEALVLACLAKEPASRPQSAVEILEGLDDVCYTTRWSASRAVEWWRSHLPDLASPGQTGLRVGAAAPPSAQAHDQVADQ